MENIILFDDAAVLAVVGILRLEGGLKGPLLDSSC
jgi:hypothetical protein